MNIREELLHCLKEAKQELDQIRADWRNADEEAQKAESKKRTSLDRFHSAMARVKSLEVELARLNSTIPISEI